MSLHLDPSSVTVLCISPSLSQFRFAEWAYAHAGVACVIRAVVTIPVDIPAFSASVRMEAALLCSVTEEHWNRVTLELTPMTPEKI